MPHLMITEKIIWGKRKMYLLICQNNCGSKNEINILNVIIHYDIASYTQLVWLGWWIAGLNYIWYGYTHKISLTGSLGAPYLEVERWGRLRWNSASSTVQTAPFTFSTRMKHLCSDRLWRTAFWTERLNITPSVQVYCLKNKVSKLGSPRAWLRT